MNPNLLNRNNALYFKLGRLSMSLKICLKLEIPYEFIVSALNQIQIVSDQFENLKTFLIYTFAGFKVNIRNYSLSAF